ncbi:BON domain-containing protein [Lacisediminimonas sp.]|uniref:BON domain-containing protein n=1 Tax=Lacisediminimonas sp. TaxID=3060582 RepID=UPI0027185ED5|nr:BON domain-containing protein [Lacisediminimonas sp.]MDO8299397.1 BON domain-containing protein [Lacisediminimonas sp.]
MRVNKPVITPSDNAVINKGNGSWNRLRRPLGAIVLCATVAVTLQGCIEMAVATAAVGTMAASDRRTLGAQTEDQTIVVKGESRVSRLVGDAGHVNVNSFNRKVLLTGEVRDQAMKEAVEREIGGVEGVLSIVNELVIGTPTSMTARSNDSLITAKVKASFIDARDLFANSFKVVTERGVVYLMGRVTRREGDRAGEMTRSIGGVQKVVKVLEYISEEELRQLTNSPEPQTNKR